MNERPVTAYLPHRPPFLWVDTILEIRDDYVETEKYIEKDLPFFEGHYPGNPIVPGVILCEAIFQTGAILMGHIVSNDDMLKEQTPVLTRIENAKFKQIVRPGDTIKMSVTLKETLSSVSYFKGKLSVNGRLAVAVSFACALT